MFINPFVSHIPSLYLKVRKNRKTSWSFSLSLKVIALTEFPKQKDIKK